MPGSADLDWPNLGFEFRDTNAHVKYTWKEGEGWNSGELVSENYVQVHIGATALHYGQACFEGLKAFAQADGTVRLFRPDENAARMKNSCDRLLMAAPPAELFLEACRRAVAANLEYVPPHGSGGALYVRPLLFGSGPRIGLQPADEYTFIVLVTPVGDYYKGGLGDGVSALVVGDYDRAAPKGVGAVKVAGNYAADLLPNSLGKAAGYPIALYLDARERKYVEEFSTSNFVGITTDGTYVTPESPAVLPSITNKSLLDLAEKAFGMPCERRPIALAEVESGAFAEVAAVGTAVVITPISEIVTSDGVATTIGADVGVPGPTCAKLYERIRAIQTGDAEDEYGWTVAV